MRFEISQSLYPGGKVLHIARDTTGVVRLRKTTLEELQQAIKEYNETEVLAKKQATKEAIPVPPETPIKPLPPETVTMQAPDIQLKENKEEDLPSEASEPEQTTGESEEPTGDKTTKKRSSKKSFWEKLK